VSAHRNEYLELCAGYAVGGLEEHERRELETHLAEGCAICEAELERLSRATWLLAASARPVKAPAALRSRVLTAIHQETQPGRRAARTQPRETPAPAPIPLPSPRPGIPAAWVWAAAAALIAVVGALQWQSANYLQDQLTATRSEVAQLRQEVENEKAWAALSAAPKAQVIQLAPTPSAAAAITARATYDPDSHRALLTFSNFSAPTGKDYELWAIGKGGPASLGLVKADSAGRAVLRLSDLSAADSLSAFAVSLENTGGAPTKTAPAGPVVMLGKIGG
jgi:anti-sigma-K factor RskA